MMHAYFMPDSFYEAGKEPLPNTITQQQFKIAQQLRTINQHFEGLIGLTANNQIVAKEKQLTATKVALAEKLASWGHHKIPDCTVSNLMNGAIDLDNLARRSQQTWEYIGNFLELSNLLCGYYHFTYLRIPNKYQMIIDFASTCDEKTLDKYGISLTLDSRYKPAKVLYPQFSENVLLTRPMKRYNAYDILDADTWLSFVTRIRKLEDYSVYLISALGDLAVPKDMTIKELTSLIKSVIPEADGWMSTVAEDLETNIF